MASFEAVQCPPEPRCSPTASARRGETPLGNRLFNRRTLNANVGRTWSATTAYVEH